MPELRQFAFVALGSNLGDPAANVLRAMQHLQVFTAAPLLRSALWQSEPVDCPPGSQPFINAVAGLLPRPTETPVSLLHALQALEREFGRKRKVVLNEPRPLDLDLLVFAEHVCQTSELTLPHPRAHRRRFVLAPFNEIAPSLILPGFSLSVEQLLAALPHDESAQKLS